MEEKVYIFDTTLRDGEQSSGVSLEVRQKVEIAKQLARLRVDVVEAGFPIASQGDFEAVRAVANEVEGPVIAALARVVEEDIKRAAEALSGAPHPRIHVFLATSEIHRTYKLGKAKEEILKLATEGVRMARMYVDEVEFSPEDASRTEPSFLYEVLEAAIQAGAGILNIPDTVGYSMPEEFGHLIKEIKRRVKGIDGVILSVHCHNDLGLAVANSLSALKNGARQIECTINGIGERAGNAALEEVVMAVKTRRDLFDLKVDIETTQLYKASRMVSHHTGMVVQPNKAIVGTNAFSHSSGIHQDGVLKERRTYEIMRPQDIGIRRSKIVLTKLSGRHALKTRLKELGYELGEEELAKAFLLFKALADKKKEVFDEDLEALVEEEVFEIPKTFSLEYLSVTTGTGTIPTATVRIRKKGKVYQESAWGNGPVGAAYNAIDKITKIKVRLLDYNLKSLSVDRDAVGEVLVRVRSGRREVSGRGISTDVIEASAKAYLDAINRLLRRRKG
jgi:2-isopropylmalate synthase